MEVVISSAALIGLRTLSEEDRRRVQSWCDHLKNWENDPFTREHSHRLSTDDNVYVLRTTTDIRVFFALHVESKRITILDIARKGTIQEFGSASESNSP